MKKSILSIAIAVIFAACSSKENSQDQTTAQQQFAGSDTAGLAEYQNWKQQKEQLQPIDMQGVNEVVPMEEAPQQMAPVAAAPRTSTRVIYRDRPVAKAPRVRKYEEPQVKYEEPDYTYGKPSGPTREAVSRNGSSVDGGVGTSESTGAGVGTGTGSGPVVASTPAEVPAKKEGWSKAAKGTAIGAASGAVLGAIVSKKKGVGAIVGGVVGGVGGYVLGRSKDKKDGRYLVLNP